MMVWLGSLLITILWVTVMTAPPGFISHSLPIFEGLLAEPLGTPGHTGGQNKTAVPVRRVSFLYQSVPVVKRVVSRKARGTRAPNAPQGPLFQVVPPSLPLSLQGVFPSSLHLHGSQLNCPHQQCPHTCPPPDSHCPSELMGCWVVSPGCPALLAGDLGGNVR